MARANDPPHFLRFAQALALVSGLGLASGCAVSHDPLPTSDAGGGDASPLADAGADAFVLSCETCDCVFGGDTPPPPNSCEALGLFGCCATAGPLPPPELAV